ncbi:pyridoxamine 5'-phosphate oxidase family protein [Kiloniella antarctica]|uniref:Pyridoxamine 5'-phosphate oxidase family protein n=1 Tax=Kiloniella antarctica TaxID=1550907 RepID=A0ABW5BJI9_9PROT
MSDSFFDPKTTPFHEGELTVQRRLGVLENVHSYAPKFVRNFLPDQHREFYSQLPQIVVGSLDEQGRPWASMVVGPAGFIRSPDRYSMVIDNAPLFGDPLRENLKTGNPLGFLGIEFHARRRNRLTGKVIGGTESGGFAIKVDQSFGNCPQFIQARTPSLKETRTSDVIERSVFRSGDLDTGSRAIISQADTFFIASAYFEDESDRRHGVDASHRGGKPGFLKVIDNKTLLFPDFPGNNHFNTIGNIELYPKVGILVPDFTSGDLLYITGTAEIIWDGPEVRAFTDAQRMVQVTIDEAVRVEKSLPMRWKFESYSSFLDLTGSWEDADEVLAITRDRDAWRRYVVAKIEKESETITSFYLVPEDKKALIDYEPGQHLPIKMIIPESDGSKREVRRTYTVSNAFNGRFYRLSIKREETGLVSKYFHDRIKPGDVVEAQAPRGDFHLDKDSNRPVVFLSGGVGVTPMIAMLESLLEEAKGKQSKREIHFIHGTRNGSEHAFEKYLNALGTWFDCLKEHNSYSLPQSGDILGRDFNRKGRIDLKLLQNLLSLDDYDFYLCGPSTFMSSLYEALVALGVRDDRIRYESFGPAMVLKSQVSEADFTASVSIRNLETVDSTELPNEPVVVRFAKSNLEAEWNSEKGSLLQLAEEVGLSPDFSCRSGNCGACTSKVKSGSVIYPRGHSVGLTDGEVLLCSAVPVKTDEQAELILDL